MKEVYKYIALAVSGAIFDINLRALLRQVDTGAEDGGRTPADTLDVQAKIDRVGVTGAKTIGSTGDTRLELGGSVARIYVAGLPSGTSYIRMRVKCGTNVDVLLTIALEVAQNAPAPAPDQEPVEYVLDVVDSYSLAGGGGGGGGETNKQFLYNAVGETTIKDKDGNILTHADIYDMLMDSPDFVVLVRADHAFHPNLVTPTQIAFTCSYLGVDGKISAERVNITSENVFSYTSGNGVTVNSLGGFILGTGTALNYALSQGSNCKAEAEYSHAEGWNTFVNAYSSAAHAEGFNTKVEYSKFAHAEGSGCTCYNISSHAEGTSCKTSAGTSHAEGNHCETGADGGSAHAEGSYTNANGAASHTEGYRTITTQGGSHAQGCWNKVEGGQYAFMHGCGTADTDRKNAFLIAGDCGIYVIGLGGYDGTNSNQEGVLSLQELFGTSNIQASANKAVNGYQVPDLTPEQVTAAYNAVVAGRSVTITDATGDYHLGVTQADVLNGDLAISLIYLNAMLLTYEISGSTVDIQFKNL